MLHRDSQTSTQTLSAPGETAPEPSLQTEKNLLTYDDPIGFGGPQTAEKSISQLLQSSPIFAPIEGLPRELWDGKECFDMPRLETVRPLRSRADIHIE